MSIKLKIKRSTHNQIIEKTIKDLIKNADKIVIGAGAGLSAAAGLDYSDELFFKRNYSFFYEKGYKTINDTIPHYWHLTEENKNEYWGFWSNHIKVVYYKQKQLKVYKDLYDIIKDKEYFIITTNVDDQFYKGEFDHNKIYAMQGSYSKFQCQSKCHDTLYDNKKYVEDMLKNFDETTLEVDSSFIPKCPKCGGLLSPNLRIDHNHVNSNTEKQRLDYVNYINSSSDKTVFLELGVGYNTPIIIRYPFEEIVKYYNTTLIRVNLDYASTTKVLGEKVLLIKDEISRVLNNIIKA